MRTILVPLDASPLAERALPYAAGLASIAGARLVLLRIPDRPPPGVRPSEIQGGAVSFAEEYLAEIADRFRALGVAADTSVPEGSGVAAQGILEAVRTREVDLVVMTTHGRSGLGRWVYGGVAHAVLAHCPVPVLLARAWLPPAESWPPTRSNHEILIPLDGSPAAEAGLSAAESLAHSLDWGLVLYRAGAAKGPDDPPTGEYHAAAAGYLSFPAAGSRLPQRPRIVVLTSPGRALGIMAEQAEASLVVMTAYGQGGPGRQLLGSVTDFVLRSGTTPLVILGPAAINAADQSRGS